LNVLKGDIAVSAAAVLADLVALKQCHIALRRYFLDVADVQRYVHIAAVQHNSLSTPGVSPLPVSH
jgi:hypothetical protein